MILTTNKESNYLAKIVRLSQFEEIEGADKIKVAVIGSYRIVVSKDYQEGEFGVLFQIESQISDKLLKNLNMFRHAELNADQEKKGFFEDNCRLKYTKLRGVTSEGLFIRWSEFSKVYDLKDSPESYEDVRFDTVNNELVCQKYIIKFAEPQESGGVKPKNKLSDLLPNGFEFHYDTSKLKDNISKFELDTPITITKKMHGTSVVLANQLVSNKLNWFMRLVNFFIKGYYPLEQHRRMYSSRKVVKGIEDVYKTTTGHYYSEDVWGKIFDRYKQDVCVDITIYGEIVGYESQGTTIQPGYDYLCNPGDSDLYVYRITKYGKEYSWEEIVDFCTQFEQWGDGVTVMKHVPVYYRGTPREYLEDNIGDNWRNDFIDKLSKEYLEKLDPWCTQKVPDEGICVRNESTGIAYKLKSLMFLKKETEDLDKGIQVE